MNTEQLTIEITTRYQSSSLTKKQAAKELQISPTQIDRLRKSGELKSVKVGGSVRIPVAVIADLVAV